MKKQTIDQSSGRARTLKAWVLILEVCLYWWYSSA